MSFYLYVVASDVNIVTCGNSCMIKYIWQYSIQDSLIISYKAPPTRLISAVICVRSCFSSLFYFSNTLQSTNLATSCSLQAHSPSFSSGCFVFFRVALLAPSSFVFLFLWERLGCCPHFFQFLLRCGDNMTTHLAHAATWGKGAVKPLN